MGKLIEADYDANGSLFSKSTFKYDEKGNSIEEATYNGKGTLTKIIELSYTYY